MSDQQLAMAVGIDSGTEGAIVAIYGDRVAYVESVPTKKIKLPTFETDTRHALAVKRNEYQSEAKSAKPRFAATNEQKPRILTCFDQDRMVELIGEVRSVAASRGYCNICVAIEAPQMLINKANRPTSVKGYFSAGRCQNAWLNALNDMACRFYSISPSTWKRSMKISSDKEEAMQRCHEMFPGTERTLDTHDKCEAALIAWFLQNKAPRYLR